MKRVIRSYESGRSQFSRHRGCIQFADETGPNAWNQSTPPKLFASETASNQQQRFLYSPNRNDIRQSSIYDRVGVLLDPSLKIRVEDSETWREATEVLQSLSRLSLKSNSLSLERVEYCFRLFDRLANELPQDALFFASLLDTRILNNVLGHWLRGIKILKRQNQYAPSPSKKRIGRRQRDQPRSPTDVEEQIDKYRWCSLVQPDHRTFTYVLDAASTEPGNFADELLEKLIQVSKDTPSNMLVDTASVCIVMKACNHKGRPEKAEEWFRRMQDLYNKHGWQQMRPNKIAYTTIIHGWAQAGNLEKAQSILNEQILDFQHGNDSCRPDTQSFNSVLHGCAKAKQNPQAMDRCKEILEQMIQLSGSADWDCAPDSYSLTSAVLCFINTAGPKRAERLLEELLEATKISPSIAVYNAILRGYAQQGKVKEAENLLQTILKANQPPPDQITFNTVLSAWAKSESPLAPQKAESFLRTMQEHGISPSVVSFGAVLQCWSRHSKQSQAAALRAEELLREMQSQHGVKPNVICYNIVLSAWANVAREFRNTDALERATLLLHELLQEGGTSSSIQPNLSTFRTMLNLIAGSTVSNKADRTKAVVDLMKRYRLEPSNGDIRLIQRLSQHQLSEGTRRRRKQNHHTLSAK